MQNTLTADSSRSLPANGDSQSGNDAKQDSAPSIERAWISYYHTHRNQVIWAIIGLLIAGGFIALGFWPTLLLAVFITIGMLYGRYKDGDRKMMNTVKNVIDRLD